MKAIFRIALYLRSNYQNKEGKVPIMVRTYLNSERLSLGSTGLAVFADLWDAERGRVKGRSMEALSINLQLDNITSSLQSIFRKLEFTEHLSLERIKSEYLGKHEDIETLVSLFEKHESSNYKQIDVSIRLCVRKGKNNCNRLATSNASPTCPSSR